MAKYTHLSQDECDRFNRLLSAGHTRAWISEVMGRSLEALRRAERGGFKAPNDARLIPVPDGFRAAALTMSTRALGAKYGVAHTTVLRWVKEVAPDRPNMRRLRGRPPANKTYPPPEFREHYLTHGYSKTQRAFGLNGSHMKRWLRDAGLKTDDVRPEPATRVERPTPPPGYEYVKHRLGPVPTIYSVAA